MCRVGGGKVSVLPQQCLMTLRDQTPEGMGARVDYRDKERVSEAKVVLELQGTPVCYIFWKRTPQWEGSPDVSPS